MPTRVCGFSWCSEMSVQKCFVTLNFVVIKTCCQSSSVWSQRDVRRWLPCFVGVRRQHALCTARSLCNPASPNLVRRVWRTDFRIHARAHTHAHTHTHTHTHVLMRWLWWCVECFGAFNTPPEPPMFWRIWGCKSTRMVQIRAQLLAVTCMHMSNGMCAA